ncbi:MAG: hypothetical protein ABI461_08425, partial [Polyangiaceae bacterium]
LDVWLDASVSGGVHEAPVATIERGRLTLVCWDDCLDNGRRAQLSFDPRDDASRLQIGRHVMEIAWSVGRVRTTYRTVVHVIVRDDGTIALARE